MQGMQWSIEVEKTMRQIARNDRRWEIEAVGKGRRQQPRWMIKLKYGENEK